MGPAVDCSVLADGELARRVTAATDAVAAEAELYRRFARRVRLYGLRHLRDAHATDDLVQRVMLLVLEKLRGGAVREPERIGSFVLGVARTLVREQRRGATVAVAVSIDGEELPPHHAVEPDPLAADRLARCLEGLAERERTVVVLTYYGDASSREIAERLALTEGHVRVLRHRAIGRLRECMGSPEGGTMTRGTPRGEVAS